MFNKRYMIEDKKEFHIYQDAKEVPLTLNRVDEFISFISNYAYTRNKLIEKYKEQGKDTTSLELDRDYALYVLGLGEKPEKFAKVIL